MYLENSDKHFCGGKECNEDNYFPLKKYHKSFMTTNAYSPVKNIVPCYEMMLGIDEVEIDDGVYTSYKRSREFINFKSIIPFNYETDYFLPEGADPEQRSLLVAYIGLE